MIWLVHVGKWVVQTPTWCIDELQCDSVSLLAATNSMDPYNVEPAPLTPIQLEPPSTAGYNLTRPHLMYFSQWGQEQYLWPLILGPMSSGNWTPFFVESGARDGEEHSNTLFLEREKNWHGLLVEPGAEFYKMFPKHRRAWRFHGGLSPTGTSVVVPFGDVGWGVGSMEAGTKAVAAPVRAEPLHALLQRIEPPVRTVDFWSLDIEGSEAAVLESTNFSKVEVGALMIEMNKNCENNRRIRGVMEQWGFQEVGATWRNNKRWWRPCHQKRLDGVFALPSYFKSRGLPVPKPFDIV